MNSKIPRIIDANTNRLMEGLRVVEDVARFVFEDKKLTTTIKDLRIKVKYLIIKLDGSGYDFVNCRDSAADVGRGMFPRSEGDRPSISQIVTSNIKRASEAARVLEEFTKLIDPKIGKAFKIIRYDIYEIEKELFRSSRLSTVDCRLNFSLYVVTDPDVLGKRSAVSAIKDAIKGGAKIVQLRDKKVSIGEYYKKAKQIAEICKKAKVTFIVNDYLDVCMALDADGVHLGQDDVPVSVARKLLGPDKIIGLSTHSKEQAIKGAKSGADYISIGPVFTTQSKPNTMPVGIELVKWASKNIKIPFVAIGGINEGNLKDVLKAGAKRAAVIRAAIGSKDIANSVKRLRRLFK